MKNNACVREVIDQCYEMKTNNMLLMQDVIIYVYEKDLDRTTEVLASMTGATIYSTLVPFLTTHIVCSKETA